MVKGRYDLAQSQGFRAHRLQPRQPYRPISAEVLKAAGVFDPKRFFGVTTLDVVRAETFSRSTVARRTPYRPLSLLLPSQARPAFELPADKYDALVNRVQFSGGEVVKAKDGAASATFSMAYARFRFAESVIKALNQRYGVSP
ncbi:malate dehydrogenase, putative [Talaromyces stipitatus ATCC 10500]|uniref:Malate dehydrogenase, putative n=1 Tax=Talaromyces stipitatus (strain ATCC 10500 / CBS 375.48 / QM 6759 / NRRL 1006) TaxID=441959 RepID=B8MUA0_TALSN|nr:malate dehydrogenase, putative [Talaromyces stipitatus ATCC 10500]EED11604.1 malate dehydrogenase, putative [Talaromyces stipitatus ATCC 10500]